MADIGIAGDAPDAGCGVAGDAAEPLGVAGGAVGVLVVADGVGDKVHVRMRPDGKESNSELSRLGVSDAPVGVAGTDSWSDSDPNQTDGEASPLSDASTFEHAEFGVACRAQAEDGTHARALGLGPN